MDEEQETAAARTSTEMRINPARAKELAENLSAIQSRIAAAAAASSQSGKRIRLVAVSKLKPATDILALHQGPAQHHHFGENYVQELAEKASLLPRSIQWHFIGGLQTNKCASLAQIPNLALVSSLDSTKKADALNKGRGQLLSSLQSENDKSPNEETAVEKLSVHVQINTSSEPEKSGVSPADAADLCRHIRDACPHLHLAGLMTIGALARSQASAASSENNSTPENEDFECLRDSRDAVARALQLDAANNLELSMGMSQDFETAIALGSDEVRVGSTIFGERPARKDAKIV
ncbi:MAG: hypothetical protein M1825_002124 [Sarcosagium campestre]|nr:MAG: hypothetical protein M1825_002124 [Sarcosagium campestre]